MQKLTHMWKNPIFCNVHKSDQNSSLCFIISALIVVVMPISLTELCPDMVAGGSGDATIKPLVHTYLCLPIWCHLTPGL